MNTMNSSFHKLDSIQRKEKDKIREFNMKTMQTVQPSMLGSSWDIFSVN